MGSKLQEASPFSGFTRQTFQFLRELGANNSREWFTAHRAEYEEHLLTPLRALVVELTPVMATIDPGFEFRPARVVSRIHRDTRFTKDKSPFRDHMWLVFHRPSLPSGEEHGFFFELYADRYRYGMGYYAARRNVMDRLRARMERDPTGFLHMVQPIEGEGRFELTGDLYKRSLRPDLPAELRRWYDRKSFYLQRRGTLEAILFGPELAGQLVEGFVLLAPLYRFLRGD